MRRNLIALTATLILAASTFQTPLGASESSLAGGSFDAWIRHRDATTQHPSLLRFYSFDDLSERASETVDLSGRGKPLSFKIAQKTGAPPESMRLIEGRWAGKKAVRLDQGYFVTEPFEVADKSFTVAAWLRVDGPGVHRGNNESTNGTLLSVGNGYWDGWRLTTTYPERTIGFEIGRPKPDNSIGTRTAPVAEKVWHHLAATWDGREMRIYVDGLLAARREYEGNFTPPGSGGEFRVGYAGSGIGSVVLDVDEVAVYGRALSSDEILRDAHFYAPLTDVAVKQAQIADQAFQAQDYATAATRYEAVFRMPAVHPDYRAVAHLQRGRCFEEQNDLRAAAVEFAAVLSEKGTSVRHQKDAVDRLASALKVVPSDGIERPVYERLLALADLSPRERFEVALKIARAHRNEKNYEAARKAYAALLATDDLTAGDRLDLHLELAHCYTEAGNFAAARAGFETIATDNAAPPHYRSNALMCIGQTYLWERDFAKAREAYEKVATIAEAPSHHHLEANERMREIARLERGQPPRDPAWNRIQLPPTPTPAVVFHVAPDGNDSSTGTSDKPFATIGRAQQAIRSLKKNGGLPAGGVMVNIRGGEYPLGETWNLNQEDSGTGKAPIVYAAAKGETPRLTGSIHLKGFSTIGDQSISARLDPSVRGKVVQVDLRALGVTDFGDPVNPGKCPELFFDGKPMQLARWPNEGYLKIGELTGEQPFEVWGGAVKGNREGRFTYEGDRPKRWSAESDIRMFGYWFWDWADSYEKVESIDTDKRIFSLAKPYPGYGFRTGQRYYAVNLLSEIDAPGEWYIDRSSGMLYFYPPSDPGKATVELSLLATPLVEMDNVSFVTLRGLTLETSRNDGVQIRRGERCLIAGCTLRRVGGDAVTISGGTGHGIFGCDMYTLGKGGTRISGGDRRTLTPGGHFIENCHVYDFSRLDRSYTPAVQMDGVGNRIAHNLFHHSPHHAMRIEGNDHMLEFNEIHSVVLEADDQGGVDMWYDPSYRGNVMRYNFWHHIGSGVGHGNAGIRLDDAICGVLIYGNVFYRCSEERFGAVQIHGGKENIIDGNLFIDCKYAITFSGWGDQRWLSTLDRDDMKRKLYDTIDIRKPPYSTRYPALANLRENPDVNSVWRNVAVECGNFMERDRGIHSVMDNFVTSQDPGFVDADNLNFDLRDDSPVYRRSGFRPIPFDEIGLYQHPLRASWPVEKGYPSQTGR